MPSGPKGRGGECDHSGHSQHAGGHQINRMIHSWKKDPRPEVCLFNYIKHFSGPTLALVQENSHRRPTGSLLAPSTQHHTSNTHSLQSGSRPLLPGAGLPPLSPVGSWHPCHIGISCFPFEQFPYQGSEIMQTLGKYYFYILVGTSL